MKNITLAQLREAENLVRKAVEDLKSAIVAAVAAAPAPAGVTIESNAPRICTVRIGAIAETGFQLSPDFYHPEAQAEIVEKALESAVFSFQIADRVSEMCESGRVRVSGVQYALNRNTISAMEKFI